MAAPPSVTIGNLTGKFQLNKSLSDDTDAVLALQGISWLTRKAIGLTSLYLDIKQYSDDNGVVHVDIVQTTSGGISGTTELRTLDYERRPHTDHIFGKLQGRTRFVNTDAASDPFQQQDWINDEAEHTGPAGEQHIESDVIADAGWTANQIWGFAIVGGERRYTRRVVVTKGDEVLKIRMVYDYSEKQ